MHIHMYTYIYIHTCECVMSLRDVFCEYVPPNKFGLCVFLSKRNIRKCINGRIINRTHHSRAMIARMQRSLKHRLISGRVRDTMKMDLCESKYLGGSQGVPLCVCVGVGGRRVWLRKIIDLPERDKNKYLLCEWNDDESDTVTKSKTLSHFFCNKY